MAPGSARPRPHARQLRSFGLVVGGIFGAIGLWPVAVHGAPARTWAIALACALIAPALVAPRILAPVHRVWTAAGNALGWLNTRILLGAIFFGIITPVGLIRRRLGGDPMRRAWEPGADSYRMPKAPRPGTHMRRQF